MIITKKTIASAIATGALFVNAFAPVAFAADTITISGNGELSSNGVNLTSNQTNTITQNNTANVTNVINSTSNTGGNNAISNTGGSVAVSTGASTSGVAVTNAANLNQVSNPCACVNGANGSVVISGNGELSSNGATVNNTNNNTVFQNNSANFTNVVNTNANTGNNNANGNTGSLGGSSVGITTGATTAIIGVTNAANANVASLGSSTGGTGTGWSAAIVGNGELSSNSITLNNNKTVQITQGNSATLTNVIGTTANTGNNNAISNTNAAVAILTGPASSTIGVDNLANFNSANVDCGCVVSGLSASVSGNGELSSNGINANKVSTTAIFHGNLAALTNVLGSNATTGTNSGNGNTGSVGNGGSVGMTTGGSNSLTLVHNVTNANSVGSVSLPGGLILGLNFDLSSLWGLFI